MKKNPNFPPRSYCRAGGIATAGDEAMIASKILLERAPICMPPCSCKHHHSGDSLNNLSLSNVSRISTELVVCFSLCFFYLYFFTSCVIYKAISFVTFKVLIQPPKQGCYCIVWDYAPSLSQRDVPHPYVRGREHSSGLCNNFTSKQIYYCLQCRTRVR